MPITFCRESPRVRSGPRGEAGSREIMRLALFQPDIPQNAGSLIRLAACLGVAVDIIEPCGFVFNDRRLRRAGMDYLDRAAMHRHGSWKCFHRDVIEEEGRRLIVLTTRGDRSYLSFAFDSRDVLMVGQESAGLPERVHGAAAARLRIPILPEARSLNVAVAAAMALGEALRQTGEFPDGPP